MQISQNSWHTEWLLLERVSGLYLCFLFDVCFELFWFQVWGKLHPMEQLSDDCVFGFFVVLLSSRFPFVWLRPAETTDICRRSLKYNRYTIHTVQQKHERCPATVPCAKSDAKMIPKRMDRAPPEYPHKDWIFPFRTQSYPWLVHGVLMRNGCHFPVSTQEEPCM